MTDVQTLRRLRLGRTDVEISPVGLGCWQFSGGQGLAGKFWEAIPQSSVDRIVEASLAGGINWFDTAEMYGHGASERALATALTRAGKANGDVVVATKWSPFVRTAASITSTFRQRLEGLAPFAIDLYQVHNPFGFSSVESEMRAMAALVAQGRIRAVGVSNFNAVRMRRAHAALAKHGIALASNQVKYSLLDRRVERNGTVAAARELGVTIIAYSPLEQGLLTGRYHQHPETMRARPWPRRWTSRRRMEQSRPVIQALTEIGREHHATAAQVALAWLYQFHPGLVAVIPGASRVEQAFENRQALDLVLSRSELQRLDEVSSQGGAA
jgi:aryl-alcohol dehydrogenase-like predicted oxidoreductase